MKLLKIKFLLGLFIYIFLSSCQLAMRLKGLKNATLSSQKNSIGMDLLEVLPGSFQMGCSNADASCDDDELPAKKIEIPGNFYLGKYEVTKKEFSIFVSETSYQTDAETMGFANTWKNCQGIKQKEDHPVICVSWNDAKEFTKWLSAKERKKYRLPTEAEWEYAARSDFFGRYYWGLDMDEAYAWFNKNSGKSTHPVGIKKPNSWGFFDMLGNVSEWCEDSYDPEYFVKKENQKSSIRKDPNNKVIRGGSWFDSFLQLRVSARSFAPKESRENFYGFRIARDK